jgi:S-adenosylmethionine decarboxylase proenzyme
MAYFDPGFVSLPGPVLSLPDPVMKPGKGIPRTTYTSKNFDTASATTHSRWVVTQKGDEQCASLPGQPACTQTHAFTAPSNEPFLMEENSLDEEHLPSGQHLLVDIENVDPVFLNSEERLASAMLELVDKCGLTLLSYHCHQLKPSGVSCAGVLLESHVSFHTWPSNGVITLDLYTCGPNSLLPVVPVVEKLFAIVSSSFSIREQAPKMIWAHKYRGFGAHTDCAEITDMFHFPLGQMSDFKKEVSRSTSVASFACKNYIILELQTYCRSHLPFHDDIIGGFSYHKVPKNGCI